MTSSTDFENWIRWPLAAFLSSDGRRISIPPFAGSYSVVIADGFLMSSFHELSCNTFPQISLVAQDETTIYESACRLLSVMGKSSKSSNNSQTSDFCLRPGSITTCIHRSCTWNWSIRGLNWIWSHKSGPFFSYRVHHFDINRLNMHCV